jgi:hypothetical protein
MWKDYSEIEEECVENPPPVRRPMKSSFIPQNITQPSCIDFQPMVQSNYKLSPHLLNLVPHYRGTPIEDPYLHICEFFFFFFLIFARFRISMV